MTMLKKGLALVLLLGSVLSVSAEVIRGIEIYNQDGEAYGIESVKAYTSLQVGQEVSDSKEVLRRISSDVDRMRDSGRFSYVNAKMKIVGENITLIYTVEAKYRLRRIVIEGADRMRNRKVLRKTELEVGQLIDVTDVAMAAEKVRSAYRDFWSPFTTVKTSTSVDHELGTMDVTFQIHEGNKVALNTIVFEGNDLVEAKTLERVIQQKRKHWYSFITGSGKYHEEWEDSDVFALKSFYMNEGFLDVEVTGPFFELNEKHPKKSKMIYRINEGRRYRVSEVTLAGMKSFNENELRRGLVLKPGEIAAYKKSQESVENLRAFYGNRGYVNTQVKSDFTPDAAAGTVGIRYRIKEGRIGYISDINISGQERTKDKVIRRELVVYPGDKYNRSRVKTSENRLRNLNYFETVSSGIEPTELSDRYDLNIALKEKPTGQFSAGVGFSSVDSLVGYVELSQGNFNIKSWPPVGGGQKFKIRAQLGSERNDLDISFVEPWFLDRKLSFGVDLYHREAEYFSDDYDQQNDGVRFSIGKPLSRFSRGSLGYTFERFKVYDVDDSASDLIKNEEGNRLKSGLDFSWTRDTRDRFFIPTRGNRTVITPYFAGGPLAGDTDIYGMKIRSGQYFPIWKGSVLNIRGQIESVESYGDSTHVPLFDRLFLGGAYTLRGFEYRDVGPKDSTGEPIGGESSAYFTVEYTVPVWRKVRAAVFYDWGVVNLDSLDFGTSGYNDDWGIGLRLDMPGFPLHLDYAWPITYDEKWGEDSGRFNFTIGHMF